MAERESLAVFRDRRDAGARLAEALERHRGADALVLGIPRGGVAVAAEVAHGLDAELDVVVARKLGAPRQPELAIGAVTASAGRYLNVALIEQAGVDESRLMAMISQEQAEARRRESVYRGERPAPRIDNRIVVLVDDGLATGATMRAAVHTVRVGHHPSRVIVAVPVAPLQTCSAFQSDADEIVALYVPEPFVAVGVHYADFTPTSDQEVIALLRASR